MCSSKRRDFLRNCRLQTEWWLLCRITSSMAAGKASVIPCFCRKNRPIWLCSIPARAITCMNTYFIPNGEGFVRQCQMTMCGSCCGCMLTAHGALVLLYRPICTHTTSATVERCIFTSTAWSLHWFRNGWGMQTWRLL